MEDEDFVCGETQDHEEETTYEDEEVWQGICLLCGAELWVDKDEEV